MSMITSYERPSIQIISFDMEDDITVTTSGGFGIIDEEISTSESDFD